MFYKIIKYLHKGLSYCLGVLTKILNNNDNKNKVKLIKNFIGEFLTYYPEVKINYYYDNSDNEFIVYHNKSDLDQDEIFLTVIGKLMRKHFYKRDTYNVFCYYDCERVNEFK